MCGKKKKFEKAHELKKIKKICKKSKKIDKFYHLKKIMVAIFKYTNNIILYIPMYFVLLMVFHYPTHIFIFFSNED